MTTRHLLPGDIAAAAEVLGAAFADDPVFGWMFAGPRRAELTARYYAELAVPLSFRRGHAYIRDDGDGVALWAPPGVELWEGPALERFAGWMAEVHGPERTGDVLAALGEMAGGHPAEAHFYLHAVGVAPEQRGQGLAGPLMTRVLEVCDSEGLVAFLESTNPRNVSFYERHGFEVTGQIRLGGDGPPVAWMQRRPAISPSGSPG